MATDGAVDIAAAKTQVVNLINTFFRDRLVAVPSIRSYLDSVAPEGSPGSVG